jgi:hypothetical protein
MSLWQTRDPEGPDFKQQNAISDDVGFEITAMQSL